jgi:thiol-disulfide isomerase/thioredoxin
VPTWMLILYRVNLNHMREGLPVLYHHGSGSSLPSFPLPAPLRKAAMRARHDLRAALLPGIALLALAPFLLLMSAAAAPLDDRELGQLFADAQDSTRAPAAEPRLRQALAGTDDPEQIGMLRHLLTTALITRRAPVDELLRFADSSLTRLSDREGPRQLYGSLVAGALLDRGERLDVADSIARAVLPPGSSHTALLRARIHLARNLPDSAIALLEPIARKSPDWAEPAARLGEACERVGRREQAIDAYVRAAGAWAEPDTTARKPLAALWSAQGLGPDSLLRRLAQARHASYRRVVFESRAADRPAPAWTCATLAGREVRSRDLSGRIVVLKFWGTSCPVCLETLGEFHRFAAEQQSREVVFLTVDREYGSDPGTLERVRALVRDSSWTLPVLYDSSDALTSDFEVTAFPTTVLVDRLGRIRYVDVGELPGQRLAREQLAALLEEKKPGPARR